MPSWKKNLLIYEINTWVWLHDLSRKYGRLLTLGSVPEEEWAAIGSLGFEAVWLMGVWERSPASIEISMHNPALLQDFRRALPDFTAKDNVGSAYSIRRYQVDPFLGGSRGLAFARKMLARRGIRLLLDYVPNHVALDHPWGQTHPEYFIQGTPEDLKQAPRSFKEINGRVLANGRDPNFPAWEDVLQVNAFYPGLRQGAIETLLRITEQCDGVRCDMAMLLLNRVFERTWGARAGPCPDAEYWAEVIPAVRKRYPDFLFMAEVYWDLEWELQQQGFDACYDKRLYDRLVHETAENVWLHLLADPSFQEKLVRFLENHDEPRAAATFPPEKARAAAVAIATLPGARLFYEGQLEGRKVRPPVFLGRRPPEETDQELFSFYRWLIKTVSRMNLRNAQWSLCNRTGWPDNQSYLGLLAWCWRGPTDRFLIVVNLSNTSAQGRIQIPWEELKGRSWLLGDLTSGALYPRSGDEMLGPGLYVDLPPWGFHLFELDHL